MGGHFLQHRKHCDIVDQLSAEHLSYTKDLRFEPVFSEKHRMWGQCVFERSVYGLCNVEQDVHREEDAHSRTFVARKQLHQTQGQQNEWHSPSTFNSGRGFPGLVISVVDRLCTITTKLPNVRARIARVPSRDPRPGQFRAKTICRHHKHCPDMSRNRVLHVQLFLTWAHWTVGKTLLEKVFWHQVSLLLLPRPPDFGGEAPLSLREAFVPAETRCCIDWKPSKAPTPTTGKNPRADFTWPTNFLATTICEHSSSERGVLHSCRGKCFCRFLGPTIFFQFAIILWRALIQFIVVSTVGICFFHPFWFFFFVFLGSTPTHSFR